MRTQKLVAKKVKWDGSKTFERFDIVGGKYISAADGTNLDEIMGRGMQFPIWQCALCSQEYGTTQANGHCQHKACVPTKAI